MVNSIWNNWNNVGEDMKEIPLTRGMVALVDDEDYEEMQLYRWHAIRSRHTWYAATSIRNEVTGKYADVRMHHMVIPQLPPGRTIDHVNGNGLDNQKRNLRSATPTQQARNASVPSNNACGFKGVYFEKRRKVWHARIKVNGRSRFLGSFSSAEEAALAYDEEARAEFGEFARPNFQQ